MLTEIFFFFLDTYVSIVQGLQKKISIQIKLSIQKLDTVLSESILIRLRCIIGFRFSIVRLHYLHNNHDVLVRQLSFVVSVCLFPLYNSLSRLNVIRTSVLSCQSPEGPVIVS